MGCSRRIGGEGPVGCGPAPSGGSTGTRGVAPGALHSFRAFAFLIFMHLSTYQLFLPYNEDDESSSLGAVLSPLNGRQLGSRRLCGPHGKHLLCPCGRCLLKRE